MTVLETLVAARKKIALPENWTQGTSARNSNGEPVGVLSNDAVCFCSTGAICRLNHWHSDATSLLSLFAGQGVASFNDTHTHADVLALFDKAIASLQPPAGASSGTGD